MDETNYYLVELNDTLERVNEGITLLGKNNDRSKDQNNREAEFESNFKKKKVEGSGNKNKKIKKPILPAMGLLGKLFESFQAFLTGKWLIAALGGATLLSALKSGFKGLFDVAKKGTILAGDGIKKGTKKVGRGVKKTGKFGVKKAKSLVSVAGRIIGSGILALMSTSLGTMLTGLITTVIGPALAVIGTALLGFKAGKLLNDLTGLSDKIVDFAMGNKDKEFADSLKGKPKPVPPSTQNLPMGDVGKQTPEYLLRPKEDGVNNAREESERAARANNNKQAPTSLNVSSNTQNVNNVALSHQPTRDDDPIATALQSKTGQLAFVPSWMS